MMDNFLAEIMDNINKSNNAHIFYHFRNQEKYLQNAQNFVISAVTKGSHVMLVENDRNLIHLQSNLKKQLENEQFEKIHFINNFDFYYSNGNFHAQTVFDYFKASIQPYLDSNVPLCTWGLVEWSDGKDITISIEQYEKDMDIHIKDKGIVSVCAYDANRTTKRLQELLMKCHGIMLTDDEIHYMSNHKAI
jgi:hypothetical protein